MSGTCRLDECTVDETGLCALDRDPLTCSNHVRSEETGAQAKDVNDVKMTVPSSGDRLGGPVLDQPIHASAFPSSRILGLDAVNRLMNERYVNVVGILGDPESGKTACLASLYLLVSNAKLQGYSFADSKSLAAFEEIARGARDWNNGAAPEQMTVHTELKDDRGAGFLHLRLVRLSDGRRIDLALPDVPGEWTQALVSSARADRLDFLKSAEVIWIVLDGRALAETEKRRGLIARVGQLVRRLKTMFDDRVPRLLAVVTHCDSQFLEDNVANLLRDEINHRGAGVEILNVAPFSDDQGKVMAGFGISDLIDRTIGERSQRPTFWPSNRSIESDRNYLRFRRDQ